MSTLFKIWALSTSYQVQRTHVDNPFLKQLSRCFREVTRSPHKPRTEHSSQILTNGASVAEQREIFLNEWKSREDPLEVQ